MELSFSERVTRARAAVSPITPDEASALHEVGQVVFVDPRPAHAIASTTGIIPGALNVALDDIADGRLPQALSDRSIQVVTACQGGPMGAIAAHELSKQGFEQVRYVDGGTQAWLDAGFATDR